VQEELTLRIQMQQQQQENLRVVSSAYLDSENTLAQLTTQYQEELNQAAAHIAELEARLAEVLSFVNQPATLDSEPPLGIQLPMPVEDTEARQLLFAQQQQILTISQRLEDFETEQRRITATARQEHATLQAEVALLQTWIQSQNQLRQTSLRTLLEDAGLDPSELES